MLGKGDCWDNSPVERFFATLKKESELHGAMNMNEIRREVFDYIAVFYNRKRAHSYLWGMSQDNFELNHQPISKCA
jgi:putative transposase